MKTLLKKRSSLAPPYFRGGGLLSGAIKKFAWAGLVLALGLASTDMGYALPGSGNMLYFDGSSYVDVSSVSALGGMSKLTLECWVRMDNASGSPEMLIGKTNAYELAFDGSTIYFKVNQETSYATAAPGLTTGLWTHIACVFDGTLSSGSRKKIYVDGILETTASSNETAIASNSNDLFIGSLTSNSKQFNGYLDEIRLWNTARTQTSIRSSFCLKLVGTETGLKGYWKLDETSGTTVANSTSTSGINGTNSGAGITTSEVPLGNQVATGYGLSSLQIQHADGDFLEVSNFSSQPDAIILYIVNEAPNNRTLPSGLVGITDQHYYGIFLVQFNAAQTDYDVSMNFESLPGWTVASALRLAYRTTNAATPWSEDSAIPDTVASTLTTTVLASSYPPGRMEYILGSTMEPLPVSLASYTLWQNNDLVSLKWVTFSEINNHHFTVERSTDGRHFSSLRTVAGNMTTNIQQTYSFNDKLEKDGIYYYRLSQTDMDGRTAILFTKSIRFSMLDNAEGIQLLSSNPVADHIDFSFRLDQVGPVKIQLLNINGQVVRNINYDGHTGRNTSALSDLSNLSSGTYFLCIFSNNTIQKQTLFKM